MCVQLVPRLHLVIVGRVVRRADGASGMCTYCSSSWRFEVALVDLRLLSGFEAVCLTLWVSTRSIMDCDKELLCLLLVRRIQLFVKLLPVTGYNSRLSKF